MTLKTKKERKKEKKDKTGKKLYWLSQQNKKREKKNETKREKKNIIKPLKKYCVAHFFLFFLFLFFWIVFFCILLGHHGKRENKSMTIRNTYNDGTYIRKGFEVVRESGEHDDKCYRERERESEKEREGGKAIRTIRDKLIGK